jgi:type VI secretion system Hcp family effector
MRIASRWVFVPLLVLTALPPQARADIITLEIPGIPGDIRNAALGLPAGAIRVLSVGGDIRNENAFAGGGGSATGKPVLSDLSLVKRFGASTPGLFLATATGKHFPEATIRFYRNRNGLELYYTITLREARVTSQKWLGDAGTADSADTESLTLSYTRITLLDAVTGARACYDVVTTDAHC